MRGLLLSVAIALLGTGLGACGGTSGSSGTTTPAASSGTLQPTATTGSTESSGTAYKKQDADKDNDLGNPHDDTSNREALAFGNAAAPADRRAITTLVKRYYAAALAGNGAKACPMLYSTFADSTPEDYGVAPGPIYLRGAKTCAEVLKRLFAYYHAQLAVEVPKLKVTHVLVKERHALALLSFKHLPERELQVTREGHAWKIVSLLDTELP